MKNGILALIAFVTLEYLFVLLRIDILEDINIFSRPQLLLVVLPYLTGLAIIEYTTRNSTTTIKLTITAVVGLAIFAIIFGLSFTTTDGLARGIWQFLALLATLPLIIYMAVVFFSARQVRQRKPEMPNQAL